MGKGISHVQLPTLAVETSQPQVGVVNTSQGPKAKGMRPGEFDVSLPL